MFFERLSTSDRQRPTACWWRSGRSFFRKRYSRGAARSGQSRREAGSCKSWFLSASSFRRRPSIPRPSLEAGTPPLQCTWLPFCIEEAGRCFRLLSVKCKNLDRIVISVVGPRRACLEVEDCSFSPQSDHLPDLLTERSAPDCESFAARALAVPMGLRKACQSASSNRELLQARKLHEGGPFSGNTSPTEEAQAHITTWFRV